MNIQIDEGNVTISLTPAELAIISQAMEAGYDSAAGSGCGLVSELRFALHNSLANLFRAALEATLYKSDLENPDKVQAELSDLLGEIAPPDWLNGVDVDLEGGSDEAQNS